MLAQRAVGEEFVTAAPRADGAVGVESPRWFIAIVGNRAERKSSETLRASGYETYVASQREKHVWKDGRSREVDRIVLPSLVFVRTTESDRKKRVAFLPCVRRFVTDPARRTEPGAPAPAAVRRTDTGRSRLYVSLDILGCASVEIDRNLLERIP